MPDAPASRPRRPGALTRSQLMEIGHKAKQGIRDAQRGFHLRHWAVMEKDSKTGLTKLLIDEIGEDAGISPRPATAAGAPERMGTPKKRRQVAVSLSVGEGLAKPKGGAHARKKRLVPKPPPPRQQQGTPRTALAKAMEKSLSLGSPMPISKAQSGAAAGGSVASTPGGGKNKFKGSSRGARTPRSSRKAGRAGSFFGDEESEIAFQLRGSEGYTDGGVGASNFLPDVDRATAMRLGVPRGNVVKSCSLLARGGIMWGLPDEEKRQAEMIVHSHHSKALSEALSFLDDLDLWPGWYHTLDYSAARQVCRAIVGLQGAVLAVEEPLVSSSSDVVESVAMSEWEIEKLMRAEKGASVAQRVRENVNRVVSLLESESEAGGGQSPSFFLLRRGNDEGAQGLLGLALGGRAMLREFRKSRMTACRERWGKSKVLLPLSHFRGGAGGDAGAGPLSSRGGATPKTARSGGMMRALRSSLGGSVLATEVGDDGVGVVAGGENGTTPGKRMRSRAPSMCIANDTSLPAIVSSRSSARADGALTTRRTPAGQHHRGESAAAVGASDVSRGGGDLLAAMQSPTKKMRPGEERASTSRRHL